MALLTVIGIFVIRSDHKTHVDDKGSGDKSKFEVSFQEAGCELQRCSDLIQSSK